MKIKVPLTALCAFLLLTVVMSGDITCSGWAPWKFRRGWSEGLSSLSTNADIARVEKISIVRTRQRGMFLTLDEFNRQLPVVITDKNVIKDFFSQLSIQMDTCPMNTAEGLYYHVVAFGSFDDVAYIFMQKCERAGFWNVWNLDGAGVYGVPTPTLLTEVFGER